MRGVILTGLLLLGGGLLSAHEGHAVSPVPDTVQDGQLQPPGGGESSPGTLSAEPEEPSLIRSLTEHFHNKLIHFPIALSLVAVLFVWLALRWSELETSAEIPVWLAAISAVVAVVTGLLQAPVFNGTSKVLWVERHEILGYATTLSLFLWALLFRFPATRRWVRIWSLVMALLVIVTASIGGLLAHG